MDLGVGIGARPRGRRRPGVGVVLAVAALLGAGAGALLHLLVARAPSAPAAAVAGGGASALHGQATWAQGVRPAPAIALRDQSGRTFALASARGHSVALAFFDSHCTQACPLEGRALAAALRSLPARERPVLVLVSVNPADTAASTRAAMRRWGLDHVAAWHWLRGRHAQLARVWKAYRIFVAPARGDIVHTEALYLIDRRGYERSGYVYPFLPRFVTLDLRALAGRGRA